MEKIIIENTSLAKAYDEVVKKWKFKDREALLKYATAIMLEADTNKLIVEKKTGLSMFGIYEAKECEPADNLINI
jgi:hypothetical protein